MADIDTGLNAWQQTSNHNRMIELQADETPNGDGPVEIAFFGSSAFRITSPQGADGDGRSLAQSSLADLGLVLPRLPDRASRRRRLDARPFRPRRRCTGWTRMCCSTG